MTWVEDVCSVRYVTANGTNLLLHSIIIIVFLPVRINDVISERSAPRLTVINAYRDNLSLTICFDIRLVANATLQGGQFTIFVLIAIIKARDISNLDPGMM